MPASSKKIERTTGRYIKDPVLRAKFMLGLMEVASSVEQGELHVTFAQGRVTDLHIEATHKAHAKSNDALVELFGLDEQPDQK